MVHVGLDLSRTRLDVHVMDESGTPLAVTTALPEAGGLAALVSRIGAEFGGPVYAAIESMNGARFVHDQLEMAGWQVEIADAQKQDRQDRLLGAGRAVAPGSGAGDLAAHPGGAGRAGTGPVAAASGAPPHRVEEPDPRHPARL